MVPGCVAHKRILDFWKGCRFVIVSGSRWVLTLWLFYMQSISVLNWMRAATGSQCKETKRGVTCALLGSLMMSRAAAF